MKVCIERNILQVELIQYRKQNAAFILVYVCEATDSIQYHPPNANQEVSNTNHFSSGSDSPGRLAAVSQCMASITKEANNYESITRHWLLVFVRNLIKYISNL